MRSVVRIVYQCKRKEAALQSQIDWGKFLYVLKEKDAGAHSVPNDSLHWSCLRMCRASVLPFDLSVKTFCCAQMLLSRPPSVAQAEVLSLRCS